MRIYACMSRYYFNVYHEHASMHREGEELADEHAAWQQAPSMAGSILRDLDGRLKPGREWKLEVTNERGLSVHVIHVDAGQVQGHDGCGCRPRPALFTEDNRGEVIYPLQANPVIFRLSDRSQAQGASGVPVAPHEHFCGAPHGPAGSSSYTQPQSHRRFI